METFPDTNLFTDNAEKHNFEIPEKQNFSNQSQETKDYINYTKEASSNISVTKVNIKKNICQKITETENHETKDDTSQNIAKNRIEKSNHEIKNNIYSTRKISPAE